MKILALSFLLLVGFSLVAEGFHQEIPKGYLYFAMAFSVFVEADQPARPPRGAGAPEEADHVVSHHAAAPTAIPSTVSAA